MQKILLLIASLFYFNFILAENEIKSWQGIHETPLSSLEQQFAEPPVEFANHVIWGWEGKMDKKTICNDLDSIKKKGFRAVIFEAGYKLPFKYLSEEWFKAIRTGVLEAKKRGMKVWIIDEGKYPSGFAGGKFSQERPDLRMQALVIDDTIHLSALPIFCSCIAIYCNMRRNPSEGSLKIRRIILVKPGQTAPSLCALRRWLPMKRRMR